MQEQLTIMLTDWPEQATSSGFLHRDQRSANAHEEASYSDACFPCEHSKHSTKESI
jgi:hypothetical protein